MEATHEKYDMHIGNVQYVIAACCVLHNICEIHRDSINDDWMIGTDSELQQPDSDYSHRDTSTDRPAGI
jgi:hypothetical protein